uniref:Uncharacterized protein n=1 Tax=Ciona savignyi TaxID=51511 RepID=H2ZBK4_CIOSA
MDDGFALVVDNGSDICEVDFARDNVLSLASIAARFHHQGVRVSLCEKDCLVGNKAKEEKSTMIPKYPIELGIVTNWDDMEKTLDHTF